jgi:hypothetical protein
MPAGIRKSGVRALNFPAGRQYLTNGVVKNFNIEFPIFEVSGVIASDSFNIEFPLFETVDLVVSYSNLDVSFPLFEAELTCLSGDLGAFDISFPVMEASLFGQRATTFQIEFPLFSSIFGADIQSTGAFAIEFPFFGVENWLIAGPPVSADYAVWVAHLGAETHSIYTQWPVNSLVRFNGRTLVALPDGIYELAKGKDVTTDVDASVLWAPSQFGNPHQKTLEAIYTAARRSGSIRVIAVCDETEKRKYTVDVPSTRSGVGKDRTQPGRGLQGSYWQIGFENVDGSDFAVSDMEVLTIPSSRRLKK